MDKIYLNEASFYGYHGVLPEETKLGQLFKVSLELFADLQSAGIEDNLDKTINYAEVYQVCKDIVEGKPYQLIEAVAEKIAQEILQQFLLVKEIQVKIIKPTPPIPGHYESVAVEIKRNRLAYE